MICKILVFLRWFKIVLEIWNCMKRPKLGSWLADVLMQSYCMFGCVELTEFWVFPQYNMPVLCGVKILHVLQLWTWRQFCFYDKAFLLLPCAICFVDWKSTFCIFMDKLCVFCWTYTILLNNWYYFIGVSPWTLERRYQLSLLKLELVVFVILRPVDHNFWNIPVYRTFRCFAEDYYSGLNFYILCLDIKRLLQWRSSWTGYISAAKIR